MEGIELEARHETDFEDVGLMAFNEEYGYFDPLIIQLIVFCVLLVLKVLYCRAQEYDDDLDVWDSLCPVHGMDAQCEVLRLSCLSSGSLKERHRSEQHASQRSMRLGC
eukprot:3650596-Rhodomonas_salina.1